MTQAKSFGEMNFGHAQLGDVRRTRRLVQLVDQMCQRPGGTLPQKFRSPADLQAFYRLMRQDDVTHAAILAAHRQTLLEQIAQRETPLLVIHDTTEFDFTTHKSLGRWAKSAAARGAVISLTRAWPSIRRRGT